MNIMDVIRVIVRPNWWMRIHPTSRALSDFIAESLDDGETPEIISTHRMRLAGVTLWRANFPYAYGRTRQGAADDFLPSRAVAMRLRAAELAVTGTREDRIRASLRRARGYDA